MLVTSLLGEKKQCKLISLLLFFPLSRQANRQNLSLLKKKKEQLVHLRYVCLRSSVIYLTMWAKGPVLPRSRLPLLGKESTFLSHKSGLVNASRWTESQWLQIATSVRLLKTELNPLSFNFVKKQRQNRRELLLYLFLSLTLVTLHAINLLCV